MKKQKRRSVARTLEQRRKRDARKLAILRAHLTAGVAELERGDFVEVDETELESYIQNLGITGKARNG